MIERKWDFFKISVGYFSGNPASKRINSKYNVLDHLFFLPKLMFNFHYLSGFSS